MTINTLYELVRNSVEKFASKVAFSMFEGDDVTYAEVGRRIEKVQEILTGAGLRAGDKVALLSSNMPNWGVCYFAVTSAGMVAVPILPDFSGEELDMIIAHSEAKALLVSDRLFTKLSKQTIERLNVVVRTKNLGVIAQRVRGEGTMAVPKPDDLAVIIYTSGTTSKPKGVMLTHAALCAQVGISSGIFPVLPDDVFLSVLPLSHTYECSIGMIYPFSMGARVVYLDRPPTASALMPALRAVRPSVMLIVPLIIEKIYRHQVLAKFNSNGFWRTLYKVGFLRRYLHRVAGKKLLKLFGGRLRFLGIGGAKLDGGAEKFLLEAKVPYAIGYGLTETAPLLAGAAPSQVRLGSTGPQAPGVQLRLEHINPDTRQGEVVALTPSVMLGYFKNPEATKEVFTDDGWFRTGDLGEFDKDGWLYIKGRLKNMIVGPGGENIYPEDIETVLNSHVYIADSIVTEQEGRLVALVHFNRDEIEAMVDNWREEWETKKEAWEAKTEQLLAIEWAQPALKEAAQKWLDTKDDGNANAEATKEYVAALQANIATVDELAAVPKFAEHAAELKAKGEKFCDCDACKLVAEILDKKDYLSKKSVWIFGGDGWAYDIGFGGVDHVLAQNKNVNVFVFDTEVYSNTGGQASKASNIGQVAQFAAAGKETKKKSLSEIAMSYGYIYVAQIAMGANPAQTIKAITEAEAYNGPSLIIGYSPCEMHSIKGGMINCQKEMKKAVECGYWNLFRFNPVADKKFTLDSKAPAGGYREFLMNEARYSRLTREFPERAEGLFTRNEDAAKERYEHLTKLIDLYDKQ